MPRSKLTLACSGALRFTSIFLVSSSVWAADLSETIIREAVPFSRPPMPAGVVGTEDEIYEATPSPPTDDLIRIRMGSSKVFRTDRVIATAVVGNEDIADMTPIGESIVVITGKGLGTTNVILLDQNGDEILDASVIVSPLFEAPLQTVRMLKGSEEFVYTCGLGTQLCDQSAVGIAPGQPGQSAQQTIDDGASDQPRANSTPLSP